LTLKPRTITQTYPPTQRWLRAAGLLLALCLVLAGCFRDPNVRKQKFVAQGDAYFKDGKYHEAQILYLRAVQIDPRYADAHYKSAQCSERLGNWNSAYQELSRTVELAPENWPAQIDLAKILLGARKIQDAKDRVLMVLEKDPKNADAKMLLSDAEAALGNQKDSLALAAEAVALAPERSASYVNLAEVQQTWSLFKEAEANLQKAHSLEPSSIAPIMLLGSLYQNQKRFEDAGKQFGAAIQVEPKNPAPRKALAMLYLAQGQIEQTEKVLSDAKAQMPDVPTGYRMLGDYYIARNDSAKALAEFASLSAAHPSDLGVQNTYVQLLILSGRLDEAGRLNDTVLKTAPGDTEARILHGQILVQRNKLDDAISVLQTAVKDAPDNAMAHLQLGYAFQRKANVNQAESEWRQAVKLQPGNQEGWRALAALAEQRRDWKELESISGRLIQIA